MMFRITIHRTLAGLLAGAALSAAPLAAQNVTNLDTAESFASIQAAIDDVDTLDGHTLEMDVASHATPELQTVFSKDLTLQGAPGGTTLSPTMNTGTSGDARGWFLIPLGRTVTFRDLTFDGSPNLVHTALRNHGALTVENCAFTEIKYNESGPTYSGIAISHFASGGAPMTVSDCTFTEIGRIGLQVFEPATIERCTYTGKGVGDWLDYFADVDAFGASVGIATFDTCVVSECRGVASSDGSTSAGILISTFFGPGTEATLTNCIFTDNTTGIYVGFDSADTSLVEVSNCSVFGNDFGLINPSTGNAVTATGNWWGDGSGPADGSGTFEAENGPSCAEASFTPALDVINADGLGDSVSDGNVNYCPWLTAPPMFYDQNVTPDAIFGGGNANGSYTVDRRNGVELGMRGKLRFNSMGLPENTFHSNGDGTYTFSTGSGGSSPPNPEWGFEWSINSDFDGSTGADIDAYEYEIGMDFDPSAGTDFLVFDLVGAPSTLPFTTPFVQPFWDHSIGDNTTGNGMGIEAGDLSTYLALISANNVAQNSWRLTFFNAPPFDGFDPSVPGRYDFYLSASDGGEEIARTEIAVFAMDGVTLSLEGDVNQVDQDPGTPGVQVATELWLRNPDGDEVSGWQAFLSFNDALMTYEAGLSSYTASPFSSHLTSTALANVAPGELRLDGNTLPSLVGTMDDAQLATLYFTVAGECTPVQVSFDLGQPFASETSFFGSPLTTDLLDGPSVVPDDTAPVLMGTPADITQPADAGSCAMAVVTWTDPTATDNCDPSPVVECSPPSGSVFPVGTTTVTCTATDVHGNESTSSFDVTVTATNAVNVVVELPGSDPTTRCIEFLADCGASTSVMLTFVDVLGTATATATIELPCGVYTDLCAKDEQHTLWAGTTLSLTGASYTADATLVLNGGDTDDDGDVDINDVTLLLAQFGTVPAVGPCPWDGVTRNADFSNNGPVGSEDYTFLTANWLATSACTCPSPIFGRGGAGPQTRLTVIDSLTRAADLNRDGFVDVLDVAELEQRHGLSGELSKRMRR